MTIICSGEYPREYKEPNVVGKTPKRNKYLIELGLESNSELGLLVSFRVLDRFEADFLDWFFELMSHWSRRPRANFFTHFHVPDV